MNSPFDYFHNKTQEDYKQLVLGWYGRAVAYIQANPEQSALIGFVVGVVTVVFIRPLISIALILALIAAVIYFMAPPGNGDSH